ncbi:MAG: type II toxin-antitoxin system prevent-host-death family antitoxin [Caulobacteraceae bacterium]
MWRGEYGRQTWTGAEAQANFEQVIEKAESEGPQRVTSGGMEAVMVVSAEDWERSGKPGTAPAR